MWFWVEHGRLIRLFSPADARSVGRGKAFMNDDDDDDGRYHEGIWTEPATNQNQVAPPDAAIAAKDAAPIISLPSSEGVNPGNIAEMVPPKTDATLTAATPVAETKGNPDALLARFNAALEAGAGQLVSQERGRGMKGGALFSEPQPGETAAQFVSKLDTTAVNAEGKRNGDGVMTVDRMRSPTLIAMKALGADQIRISTFYRNNGKEYVSTTGGKGERLDLVIKDGWEIAGAMKGEPTRGHAETYSLDEWKGVAEKMREALNTAKGHAEAVGETLEQAKDWDRTDANGDADSHGHATGDDVVGEHEGGEAMRTPPGYERNFTTQHAEAIVDAVRGVSLTHLDELYKALKKAGPDAIIAFKVMVRDIYDASGEKNELAAVKSAYEKIYESRSKDTTAESLVESTKSGDRQKNAEGAVPERNQIPNRSPDDSSAAAPAGDQPGAGGAPAGADANAERGGQLPAAAAEPAAADAAAASPRPADTAATEVKPPKVEVADKGGIVGKEAGKLQAIAERLAEEQGHEGRDAIEADADEIIEGAIAAKVDGEPALIYS
jgi:hypothetical protein